MRHRLWSGKRKIQKSNNPKVGPRIYLPRWWVGEDDTEIYMEVFPDFILIYRLDFERADKVLEELTKRQGGERR